MSPSPATPDRPLRRDAERNRQRIMDAARVVFAERGLRASHDDIAREAGVGVGTVYRRFPDKELLIDALFEERLEEITAIAEQALAMDDPGEGLVFFLVRWQELQCADRGLKELSLGADRGAARVASARDRLAPQAEALLARARAAGAVRSDLALTDLPLIQHALGAIADVTHDIAPAVWRRTFALLVDGLRPARTGVTPFTEPSLTAEQLTEAVHAGAAPRAER